MPAPTACACLRAGQPVPCRPAGLPGGGVGSLMEPIAALLASGGALCPTNKLIAPGAFDSSVHCVTVTKRAGPGAPAQQVAGTACHQQQHAMRPGRLVPHSNPAGLHATLRRRSKAGRARDTGAAGTASGAACHPWYVPGCSSCPHCPAQLGSPMAAASEGACCTLGPASPAPLPLGTAAACCACCGGPTSTSCFTQRCRSDTCGVGG